MSLKYPKLPMEKSKFKLYPKKAAQNKPSSKK
jgi:hypothetical protein